MPLLEGFFYDLRLSLRTLCRDKVFSLAAIAMLALAIGLNVTAFAIMNTMLFSGFPLVQRNDALVYIQERLPSGRTFVSYADFEDWRSQANAFEGMAYVTNATFSEAADRSIDALAATVSTNTFRLLRVLPMLGRDFVPADEVPGAPVVVILNYRFWESRFNKRPDIVGLNIHINGDPATIIAVMPPGFDFPNEFSFWMPLQRTGDLLRRGPVPGVDLWPDAARAWRYNKLAPNWKRLTAIWKPCHPQTIVVFFPWFRTGRRPSLVRKHPISTGRCGQLCGSCC
jgi:hypothetical protein